MPPRVAFCAPVNSAVVDDVNRDLLFNPHGPSHVSLRSIMNSGINGRGFGPLLPELERFMCDRQPAQLSTGYFGGIFLSWGAAAVTFNLTE